MSAIRTDTYTNELKNIRNRPLESILENSSIREPNGRGKSSKILRANLHGTIFAACDKLTTGLRHYFRLPQHFKTCFKMLRHFF